MRQSRPPRASVDGQVLTVKYKSGDKTDEKKVIVPPDAAIVTYAPADRSELKAGAQIIIFGAQKQAGRHPDRRRR